MFEKIINIFREQSWKAFGVHLGLMITLVFGLLLLFFFVYLPSTTRHDQTITVPNTRGMQLADMDEFLKKRNLNYEVYDSIYDQKYPPLSIYTQYPLPGAHVKEHRKIYLTYVKSTPDMTNMPLDLIDGSLKNAELILENYGLKRGKITYKADLASNAVLEHWYNGKKIEPGAPIARGSKIDLIVGDGLGQRVFSVPRFIGLPIDEADFAIRGSGLNTGSVIINVIDEEKLIELVELARELEIDTVTIIESGAVFQQRPDIGNDIRLGQQVDLWVVSLNEEDSLEVLENWLNKSEEQTGEESDFNEE
jgi:beta-lactam-binding protein with PASTA domain